MSHRIFGGIRVIAFLSVVLLLGSAVPSYALFEKLDHLSGPGPFHGIELQFRAVCVNRQPSKPDIAKAIMSATLATPTSKLLSNSSQAMGFINQLNERARVIGDNKNPNLTEAEILQMAAWSRVVLDSLEPPRGAPRDPISEAAIRAWDRVERTARATLVPRVRHLPGSILWASCYDGPNAGSREVVPPPYTLDSPMIVEAVVPSDRRPIFSLNVNYRYYTTGVFFFSGPHTSTDFARGEPIQLQMLQVQPTVSIPKTLGILDAQFGIGYYRFTSSDFVPFGGLVLEPRFDAHFPARLLDEEPSQALKLLYSLSLRVGWMNFPDGIDAAKFHARRGRPDIASDEFTFDYGVVIDVGRLFGR